GGLSFVDWSGESDYEGVLESGQFVVYRIVYAIDQDDINRGFVRNWSHVMGEFDYGGDTRTVSDFYCTETNPEEYPVKELVQQPELTVEKRVTSTGPYSLGYIITYDISVENTGNVSLNNVTVNDDNAEVVNPGDEVIGLLEPGDTETVE